MFLLVLEDERKKNNVLQKYLKYIRMLEKNNNMSKMYILRMYSGLVRFAVGRPEVHSPCPVIPKDCYAMLSTMLSTASLLGARHLEKVV